MCAAPKLGLELKLNKVGSISRVSEHAFVNLFSNVKDTVNAIS